MKTAVLLHGKPSKEGYYDPTRESQSNEHWFPWLQHELIIRDILAQTPELPRPYQPNYEAWKEVFERYAPDADTYLVGHSCGAGFLVRWLSENKDARVGKVVLVAPSLALDWEDTEDMFKFELDPMIASRAAGITMFVAKDDKPGILEASQKLYAEVQDIQLREFETGGHFTFAGMGKREFPELLEEVLA